MKTEKNYSVYFEIYGKKMKVKVVAKNEAKARIIVIEKIIFHKTVAEADDEFNKATGKVDDLFDMLNNIKPK